MKNITKKNINIKTMEVQQHKWHGYIKFVKTIQEYSEKNQMQELHKHMKTLFKMKNPSPIMQDIIDP